MSELWIHRFAVLLAICTLFLVVAGASVVSKEAGLSVPDWPLSYGKVLPEMTGGVFFEHGHRMVATTVGLLTIVLVVWLRRSNEPVWLKKLSVAALAAVIVQGLLGGMTVLFLLPKAVSISHACLAQLFFSATVAMALFTSPGWKAGAQIIDDSGTPSLRTLAAGTAAAAFVQVALGAAYRHKALGVLPHVLWAAVVAVLIMMVGTFTLSHDQRHAALRRTAAWLLVVTGVQVILGVVAYTARVMTAESATPQALMVWTTVTHTALGAVVLAATVVMAIETLRNVRSVRALGTGDRLAPTGRTR